jgi:hypothetical protein
MLEEERAERQKIPGNWWSLRKINVLLKRIATEKPSFALQDLK